MTLRTESKIEAAFVRSCARYGGIARKLTSPGAAGVPDRFVIWDKGVTTYAELKREKGGVASPLQSEELEMLLSKGHLAMVVSCEMDIAMFIKLSLERVRQQ